MVWIMEKSSFLAKASVHFFLLPQKPFPKFWKQHSMYFGYKYVKIGPKVVHMNLILFSSITCPWVLFFVNLFSIKFKWSIPVSLKLFASRFVLECLEKRLE